MNVSLNASASNVASSFSSCFNFESSASSSAILFNLLSSSVTSFLMVLANDSSLSAFAMACDIAEVSPNAFSITFSAFSETLWMAYPTWS